MRLSSSLENLSRPEEGKEAEQGKRDAKREGDKGIQTDRYMGERKEEREEDTFICVLPGLLICKYQMGQNLDPRAAELAAGRKKMRLSRRKNCG